MPPATCMWRTGIRPHPALSGTAGRSSPSSTQLFFCWWWDTARDYRSETADFCPRYIKQYSTQCTNMFCYKTSEDFRKCENIVFIGKVCFFTPGGGNGFVSRNWLAHPLLLMLPYLTSFLPFQQIQQFLEHINRSLQLSLQCSDTVSWATGGHPACKKLPVGVGLLVVTIWPQLCTLYSCSCHRHLHHS